MVIALKPLENDCLKVSQTPLKSQVDLCDTLTEVRSKEARELEKESDGKIELRADGKINFPKIGITGAARLSSAEKSTPEKGIVQGDYKDQYTTACIPGLTYLTGQKAIEITRAQNLKLFPASEAEQKTNQLLTQLGATRQEQSKALQTLFGATFSGYWHPFSKKRTTMGGSVAYLGLSEVSIDGCVSAIEWTANDATQCWNYQHTPQPFLAFEEC